MNSVRDTIAPVLTAERGAPPRRNARQERQRQETRRALVAAACEVFGERGYLDTTVEHVLARAGVSRAAFYAHFDGKLSLVCALATDFVPVWRPVFEALVALDRPGIDDLERWAAMHLALHAEHKAVCGLLTQVATLEDRLYWHIEGQREALIEYLGEHLPAFGRARTDPRARVRAQHLLIALDHLCFMIVRGRIADPSGEGPRLIAEQVHSFLKSGGENSVLK